MGAFPKFTASTLSPPDASILVGFYVKVAILPEVHDSFPSVFFHNKNAGQSTTKAIRQWLGGRNPEGSGRSQLPRWSRKRASRKREKGLCGIVGNPEGILPQLALTRVTTRIVLREKKR